MPKRRNYPPEFKREAVALANQPGVTKAQLGRELVINPNMITRWQRELAANKSRALPGQGVARHEEMAALKRENARLRNERDFFARSGYGFNRSTQQIGQSFGWSCSSESRVIPGFFQHRLLNRIRAVVSAPVSNCTGVSPLRVQRQNAQSDSPNASVIAVSSASR